MLSVEKIAQKASFAFMAIGAFAVKSVFMLLSMLIINSCSSSIRFAEKKYESKSRKGKTEQVKPFPKVEYEKELASVSPKRRQVVYEALGWIGTPYLWGGDTRRGVDCSGLVKNVMSEIRLNMPRTAAEQYCESKKIEISQRLPGDLVFFTNGVGISHVGIYIGAGYLVHASTSSGVIRQSIEDSYLKEKFVSFARVSLD